MDIGNGSLRRTQKYPASRSREVRETPDKKIKWLMDAVRPMNMVGFKLFYQITSFPMLFHTHCVGSQVISEKRQATQHIKMETPFSIIA